jgi:hypothetical protein
MKSDTFSLASTCSKALPGEGFLGKALVVIGLAIAAVGVAILIGVPLGRLPGDIAVRRGNVSFYFPVVTSIVLSILLTLILSLFRR